MHDDSTVTTTVTDVEISAGDLWSLSWDGEALGYILIARAFDGYVLGWPVTRTRETSYAPGLLIDSSPLGEPITLWPTRETGLGTHLLDTRNGALLTPSQVRAIAWAIDDGKAPPLPTSAVETDDEQDALMVEHWADLCFHEWPDSNLRFLDEAALRSHGVRAGQVRDALGLDAAEVRELWLGSVPVSDAQVAVISDRFGISAEDFTDAGNSDAAVAELMHPRFKRAVQSSMHRTGYHEGELRERLRAASSLAARDDAQVPVRTKVLDAIKRLTSD